MISQVEKPLRRSRLRRMLGKEFYILRRKLKWCFSGDRFAGFSDSTKTPYVWMSHHSTLLRKLKDVDMHLQYNKVDNLRIAISRIDGVVIKSFQYGAWWDVLQRERDTKKA